MRKTLSLCLMISLFFATFLVVNIYQTKDILRIQTIEMTPNSFHFFVEDSRISPQKELAFFSKLSKEEGVSIFKTESNGMVVKSVVFDRNSFPFQEFHLKKEELFKNDQVIYASFDTHKSNQLGKIPVFSKKSKITLQTLENYFLDPLRSVNGTYSIVSTGPIHQDRIVKKLESFFFIPKEKLLNVSSHSAYGFVNRNLVIFLLFLILSFLVVIIVNIYSPLMELKTIGIKKLNGISDSLIFWEFIKGNLFLLLVSCGVIDSALMIYFRYRPQHFLSTVIFVQNMIVFVYLLLNLFVYFLIKKVTLNQLLKNFLGFRYGMVACFAIKGLLLLVVTASLLQNSIQFAQLFQQYQREKLWKANGDWITLEYSASSGADWENEQLANGKTEQKHANLFLDLEKSLDAQYVFSEVVNPNRNLTPKGKQRIYSPDERYELMHVNENFLKTLPIPISLLNGEVREFLIPNSFRRNEKKIRYFCQHLLMSDSRSKEGDEIETIPVKLHYYEDKNFSVFSHRSSEARTFTQPIFLVINPKNLTDREKSNLLNSGEKNPMKIRNSTKNQEILKKIVKKHETKTLRFKFSTIRSIIGEDTYTLTLSVGILLGIFVIVFALNLLSLLFLLTCMIQGKKKQLSVYRLLGVKLFDRYRVEFLLFGGFYLIQFAALLLFGKTWVMLLFALGLIGIEVFVIGWVIGRKEQKNLALLLKGE